MAALDRLPDKSTKAAFDASMAVAYVFQAHRDFGAAVPFLEKAAQIDPASTRARSDLVVACARAGQIDDAVRNLKALLSDGADARRGGGRGRGDQGDGGQRTSSPSTPGLEPPAVLRVPTPRYPKGQDMTVQTEVLILTQVKKDNTVGDAVMVPNRIWKDMRTTGFEQEAIDAVKRGKFVARHEGRPRRRPLGRRAVRFARTVKGRSPCTISPKRHGRAFDEVQREPT
jgi:hypothetical protein